MALPTGDIALSQIQDEFDASGIIASRDAAGLSGNTALTDFRGMSAVSVHLAEATYGIGVNLTQPYSHFTFGESIEIGDRIVIIGSTHRTDRTYTGSRSSLNGFAVMGFTTSTSGGTLMPMLDGGNLWINNTERRSAMGIYERVCTGIETGAFTMFHPNRYYSTSNSRGWAFLIKGLGSTTNRIGELESVSVPPSLSGAIINVPPTSETDPSTKELVIIVASSLNPTTSQQLNNTLAANLIVTTLSSQNNVRGYQAPGHSTLWNSDGIAGGIGLRKAGQYITINNRERVFVAPLRYEHISAGNNVLTVADLGRSETSLSDSGSFFKYRVVTGNTSATFQAKYRIASK